MKWFYNWLAKKCKEASYNSKEHADELNIKPSRIVGVDHDRLETNSRINFSVHRASGGFVVEANIWDPKIERSNKYLHIITDDKDLGEEIGKIITYTNLRA